MKQKQAVTPPAATAPRAAGTAGGAAASGSRWLGPLAGIAAGLGLAALLAHFGLAGAMADLLVIALIAAIAIFGIRFILRTLSSVSPQALGNSPGSMQRRQYGQDSTEGPGQPQVQPPVQPPASGLFGQSPLHVEPSEPSVGDWFIPADFDAPAFLEEAKKQFVAIQKAWDTVDFDGLQSRLTEELYAEYAGKMAAHGGNNHTEVVLLNADLLGIEKLKDGHLASVRFSGMIREDQQSEAASFEEVWNLYKPDGKGWLLAGIQQLNQH
jgi:predicted lipid-binding transport protein (Tim44 family)